MFSALLFPKSKPAQALLYIVQNHKMVLCEQNITELRDILQRKAPEKLPVMDVFLNALAYDLIPAIDYIAKPIRDGKDQPILNAAIFYEIDMILTGDKDFLCLNLDYPKCVNVSEFMNREGIVF